jgi:PAS domain S-box-containing protein
VAEFLQIQWDYMVFIEGFLWIAFGAAALNIRHLPRHQSFLQLGLFGLFFGAHEWTTTLTNSGSEPLFVLVRLGFLVSSFFALLEFARVLRWPQIRQTPVLVFYSVLAGFASLGVRGGQAAMDASCCMALGLPGGILASVALLKLRRGYDKAGQASLVWLSISMAANILLIGSTGLAIEGFNKLFPRDSLSIAVTSGYLQLVQTLVAFLGLVVLTRYGRTLQPASGNPVVRRMAPLAIIFLMALGWFTADRRGSNADMMMRQSLLYQAIEVANTINPSQVKELSFTEADRGLPAFENIREQMIAHGRYINQRCIYSMGVRDGQIYFGPESLPEGDPMASPPGTLYEEPGPEDFSIFQTRKSAVIGPQTDEYGTFLSATAPIVDPDTHTVLMVVGVDVPAEEWIADIQLARLTPILASMALSLIFLVGLACLQWRNRLPVEARHPWRYIEAAMVAICGLAITATITVLVMEAEISEHRTIFLRQSDSMAETIRDEFLVLKSNLASVVRFYEGSQFVDRREFHNFVEPIIHNTGIRAIEWIPNVPQSGLYAYQDRARNEGLDSFTIYELDPHGNKVPVGSRSAYFPVYYVEPLAGNESALGYDLASEPTRREALTAAIRTGMATATNPITLVQEPSDPFGILVYQPFYTPSTSDDSAGIGSLEGLTVGVINFQALLNKSMFSAFGPGTDKVSLDLMDLMSPQGPKLLASYPAGHSWHPLDSLRPSAPDQDGFVNVHPLFFFGRSYGIVVHTVPSFNTTHPIYASWISGIAGLLLTSILTLFVAFLRNRHAALEEQVRQRTAELQNNLERIRLNEQRLDALVRLNGMAEESLQALCQYAMEEAVRLTGSTIGYLAFVSEDEKVLTMHAWSHSAMKECRIENKPIIYPVEKTGLWGEAIRQRKPVITNDYSQPNSLKKGCPQGHVSVLRHMNAPIFDGDRIVIVAGVGNKRTDYDQTDIRQLTLLMQGMWSLAQRKKAEETLRLERQRLASIIEGTGVGTWEWNVQTGETIFNDRWAEIAGFALSELEPVNIGTWLSLAHPDDLKESESKLQKHFAGELDCYDCECRMRHKEGSWIWVHNRGKVMEWTPDGKPLRMFGTHSDITDRKRSEGALRESEQKARAFFDSSFGFIGLLSPDGRVVEINKTALDFAGVNMSDVEGKPFWDTVWWSHNSDMREFVRSSIRSAAAGTLVRGESIHLAQDGTRHTIDFTLKPVPDETGRVVHLVAEGHDITDRKQTEDNLRKAMEAANAANVAKSRFLANMSHEIRTPMNAILGFAELLAQDKLSPQQSDFVQTIRNSGSHLLDLINDILDFSKIEAGKMTLEFTECLLETLLNEIESLMAPFAKTKGLRFEMTTPTDLPRTIRTDPVRLRQCLTNLVNNAIKFTEAGHVIVRTAMTESEGKPFLRFEVEDTGPGIDPRVRDKIFEAFEQADGSMTRKFGGTGLGLTITRHLVELFGGSLTLTSELGKGSTFVIEMPANVSLHNPPVQSEHTLPGSPESSESPPQQFQGHVLVAEDVKTNQVLIRILLNQVGVEPVIVDDGQAAVEQVLRHPFDLILLDMQMPRLNGFEAARKLRKQGIRTPIVALTAGAIKGDEQKCRQAGCDEYLTKPINRKELLRILALYLSAAVGLQSPA